MVNVPSKEREIEWHVRAIQDSFSAADQPYYSDNSVLHI